MRIELRVTHRDPDVFSSMRPISERAKAHSKKELDQQAAGAPSGPTKGEMLHRLKQIRLKANNALGISH